jgi:PadR family transcriptional regulator PadR
MVKPPRLTQATMGVLDVLAASTDDDPAYGFRICAAADLGPGTVYPILERLVTLGWLKSWPETGQPSGRPARRFYSLTGTGRLGVAEAHAVRERRRTRWASLLTPRRSTGATG